MNITLSFRILIILIIIINNRSYGQIDTSAFLCQPWLKAAYNDFVLAFPCDTTYYGDEPYGPTIQRGNKDGQEYIHIRKLVVFPPPFFTFNYESKYYDLNGVYLGDGTFDGQGNGFGGDFEENEELLYHCSQPYPNCCIKTTIEMVQGVECILPQVISTGGILYPCAYINGASPLIDSLGYMAEITYEPYSGNDCFSVCLQGIGVSIGCVEKQDSCATEIEMVQGVECILPQVISTGEILYPCEYTNGATALPDELGYKTKIAYIPYEGNQCFSVCQQGTAVSVGCVQPLDTCIYHPDYAPLMALYNATNGPGWTNNTGWVDGSAGTNCDPCNGWYGVICSNGRVSSLDLKSNNLNGIITPEIGNLSLLQGLYAQDNRLNGSIPSELGSLSQLQYLILNNNQLSGSIPLNISNLTQLRHLFLNDNNLTGSIPSQLGNLLELEFLVLNRNALSGSVPSELGNLLQLQYLYLNDNDLSDCIPQELQNICSNIILGSVSNNPFLATQSWTNFCNNQEGMCSPSNTDDEAYNHVYNIYPNPSSDHITIENIEKIEKVAFASMDGSSIYSARLQSQGLDVSTLPSAIYAVRITAIDGKIHHIKFVKK